MVIMEFFKLDHPWMIHPLLYIHVDVVAPHLKEKDVTLSHCYDLLHSFNQPMKSCAGDFISLLAFDSPITDSTYLLFLRPLYLEYLLLLLLLLENNHSRGMTLLLVLGVFYY